MSDRIAVMRAGVVEQLADPFAIYDAPASVFVASFIGQQNLFEGESHEEGKVVVSLLSILESTRQHPTLATGASAIATVRPDAIRVQPLAQSDSGSAVAPGRNTVSGVLAAIAHLGDSIQYLVAVPGRGEIIARAPRAQISRIDIGAEVICSWSSSDVYVFVPTPTQSGPEIDPSERLHHDN